MARMMDRALFGAKTGKSFEKWVAFLDQRGGRNLDHKTLARLVEETGEASAWWAQGIVVAYEQEIGRRQPGEVKDGFRVAVTRKLDAAPETVMARLMAEIAALPDFAGIAPAAPPRESATDKRLFFRQKLAEGQLEIAVARLGPDRAEASITQSGLADAAGVERVRAFWKAIVARL